MKAVLLCLSVSFGLHTQAQGLAQPQAPLLKEVAACFQSLPVGRRSKSKMQFYSEIVKSSGPDCTPLMLIVKNESQRVPSLSVYRDNASGQIEGLHASLSSKNTDGSNYIRMGHPNGREDVTYSCQFTSKENIAQYGEQKSQRPLIVNVKTYPPTIQSDMNSPTLPKKSVRSNYGYNERELLKQIRAEIALRTKEMGSNARISRDQYRGLENCLGLITQREKSREISDKETETLLKKWLGQNDSHPAQKSPPAAGSIK